MISGLLAVSLAACGSESSSTTAAGTSETSTASSSASTSETTSVSTSESAASSEFAPALDTSTEATLYVVGSWGNFEALDQVALDFQKYYPGVEVVYTKLDDYRNDLANKFVTGEEIDLFMNAWWDTEYTANDNIIENAEDLYDSGIDFSNIDPDMLSTGLAGDELVMVPIYLDTYGCMVNTDIFAAAGVDVPGNYEELLSACEALAAAGYDQPIYANSSIYGKTFTGYYMERLLAGSDEVTALDETIAHIDALYDTGYVSTEGDSLEDSYNAVIMKFFEGDTAIVPFSGSSYSGTKKREAKSEEFTAEPFSYAFIGAPYSDGDGSVYIDQLGTIYMGVYKNSTQIDLANEFLRFMLTNDEMLVLQEIKNMPTTNIYNGLDNFPYLADAELYCNTTEGISSLDEERINNVLNLYEPGTDHAEMYEKMNDYLENGING